MNEIEREIRDAMSAHDGDIASAELPNAGQIVAAARRAGRRDRSRWRQALLVAAGVAVISAGVVIVKVGTGAHSPSSSRLAPSLSTASSEAPASTTRASVEASSVVAKRSEWCGQRFEAMAALSALGVDAQTSTRKVNYLDVTNTGTTSVPDMYLATAYLVIADPGSSLVIGYIAGMYSMGAAPHPLGPGETAELLLWLKATRSCTAAGGALAPGAYQAVGIVQVGPESAPREYRTDPFGVQVSANGAVVIEN